MAESHDVYEPFFREPRSTFDHVIEHHGYLRNGSANIDKAKHQEVKKDLSPAWRIVLGYIQCPIFLSHSVTSSDADLSLNDRVL